jgi:hypothetical protein
MQDGETGDGYRTSKLTLTRSLNSARLASKPKLIINCFQRQVRQCTPHMGRKSLLHYVGQMILCGIKIWFYWGMFPQKPFRPLQVFVWIPNPPKEQTIFAMIEAKCSSSGDLPQPMLPQLPSPADDHKSPGVKKGSRQK